MGKNNRARRAAKAKAKADRQATRASGASWRPSPPGPDPTSHRTRPPEERIAELLHVAPQLRAAGAEAELEDLVIELCRFPIELLRASASATIVGYVGRAWSAGWQPAELARHARRTTAAPAAHLVRSAIAADHAPRSPASLDPRWTEQLASLDLPTGPDLDGWLRRWATGAGVGVVSELDTVIETLTFLRRLPPLEELIPPPGGSTRRAPTFVAPSEEGTDAERAMLGKIRALLAKAESTTFEAEAEALTAKAQELMTRYAIDAAVVASGRRSIGEEPIAIRVGVDDPYIDAKSLLIQVVANAGRCRAVFDDRIAATTVVGFRTDVIGVELLYTSLLVQAQTSLTNAAKALPAGARQRSRGFRSSFLLAYANRIGQRLQEIDAEVIAEAEAASGQSILPVLRSREIAVAEAVEERFGPLVSKRVRGGQDAAGWHSGTRAADEAAIVAGALPNDARSTTA